VRKEFGNFRRLSVELRRRQANPKSLATNGRGTPRATAESNAMSRDLLRRGFKFVGSTILLRVDASDRHGQRSSRDMSRDNAELGGIRQRSSRSQRIRKEEQKTTKITEGSAEAT